MNTKWIIRNAVTEDVLEGFGRDGYPKWVVDNPKKWKWFKTWTEVQSAVTIIRKCGDDCYPVSLASEER